MKTKLLLFFALLLGSPPLRAISILDIMNSMQSWKMRFDGYRSYRVELKDPLQKGEKCILGVTAHVNPKVKNFTVALMGLAADRWNWSLLLEHYENHPQESGFILVDWPYHGDSNCDVAQSPEEIARVVYEALKKFGRPINRIVAASLGSIPAAYLKVYYPEAQQVWITPPFLKVEKLVGLRKDVLAIDSPSEVKHFLSKTYSGSKEIPDAVIGALQERIARSQIPLRAWSVAEVRQYIFSQKYENLLIVIGAQDKLLPYSSLDPRLQSLTKLKMQTLACGHDLVRRCGADLKSVMEASRRVVQD